VGLYSLSSSVGWKAGDFTASEVSLAFPQIGINLDLSPQAKVLLPQCLHFIHVAFLEIREFLLDLCLAV